MKDDLKRILNRPLEIGGKLVDKRLILAPMARIGNLAFRELVLSFGGCGLVFSEMTNARSIPSAKGYGSSGFRWNRRELPRLVCQIYGNEPEIMARAARYVEEEGFFGLDINFGCSAATICKKNLGAALLRDPILAEKIVSSVRKVIKIPLFVKYRAGWRNEPVVAVELAKRFEQAGADALTFHPRVAPDMRTRPARWRYLGDVKSAVSIPVFGNGDVFDGKGCLRMLSQTGCDGVALGRLAASAPWVFAEWTGDFKPGKELYMEASFKMAELLSKYFEQKVALRRFRLFSTYFAANFRFGHSFRSKILKAESMDEIRETLSRFFGKEPDIASSPNIDLFR